MSVRLLMTLDAAGGVWRYAMDLARALKGAEVVFLGFGPPPSPDQRAEAEALGCLDWADLPLDWTVTDAAALKGVPVAIERAATRHRVDLIHLNLPTHAAGLRVEVPVVAVSHSCVSTWFRAVRGGGLPEGWEWQRDLNLAGLRRADAVVAPSASHARLLRQVYGPLDVVVVPNATLAPATQTADRPTVVASGRWWDDGKNGATLDRAAARMVWPVTLLGPLDGPTGQRFTPIHATAAGHLPHAQALGLMRDAGIFVSPSLYEPFGLAVAEAARAAIPLVLADIPTFRELWDGAALFFPPADDTALAQAVNRLAADPDLRRRMGQAARDQSHRFAPAAQAGAMMTLYARLTEPQRQAATR
ncbi:glycosyltransferase family 4 protein [Falsirhodobacter sp. 20TX0035]|uniref:glycosyltransferase family 4 protein n=1 Tax=Falsirhodobacter sp. 20TX0035 TaxID=3022019 RepID=UPI00232B39D7|nr:glycosyltransferase family 4 protein [Falsirhodobacter sp. 20TX0035]MDB6453740.1 glycosyltransferase family 4 protein [Falsirhodobacter sp. 20TX0035]